MAGQVRLTTGRAGLLVGVLALLALVVPAGATAAPTLKLSPFCDYYPPSSGIAIDVTGLPPSSSFEAKIEFTHDNGGGGSVGPVPQFADAAGNYHFTFGADTPSTYTVTIAWTGGTLRESLHTDCSAPEPPPEPASKADCKRGGWRQFGFRNQGQCVSSVAGAANRSRQTSRDG